jgi:hypothetical protein
MSKRKAYKPKTDGKMAGAALTSMRETAFGRSAYFATKRILEHAERLRPDDDLIAAAEAKRARKAAARMKAVQK